MLGCGYVASLSNQLTVIVGSINKQVQQPLYKVTTAICARTFMSTHSSLQRRLNTFTEYPRTTKKNMLNQFSEEDSTSISA